MKILFVTHDRNAAQLGVQALHGMAPQGTFTWTQTPRSALRWLQTNRDAGAVVLEAERRDGAAFVEQVRALGLSARVVVVPSGRFGEWLASRNAGGPAPSVPAISRQEDAQASSKDARASSELAAAARLAAEEAKHRAALARTEKLTVVLQGRLLELEAALGESRNHLTRREQELRAELSRAAASQSVLEERLAESAAELRRVRENAAAESDAARRQAQALAERLSEEAEARESLEQHVAAREAARADTERRHAAELAGASAHLTDLQRTYDRALTEHASVRTAFERQLADAAARSDELVSQLAAAAARHETIERRLAGEARTRENLERELAALEARRADEERRHATDLADLSGRLAAEITVRETLARDLASLEAARAEADRRHASELAGASVRLAELQSTYDDALAAHDAARIAFERQLTESAAAREQLVSEIAAAAARHETAVQRLADEARMRETLERELAAVEAARAEEERRHATELADVSARLAAEITVRETLARDLAAVDAARTDDERLHAAELAGASARLADLQRTYDSALTEQTAARTAFEQELAAGAADREQLVSEVAAAAARHAGLENRLAEESTARAALEQKLAGVEAARTDAARRHAAQLADTAARLADLQTRYDVVLADHARTRIALERQLADAAAAAQRLMMEAAAAAERQKILEDRLAAETRGREALEVDLAAAKSARAEADRLHSIAAEEAADRLGELRQTYDAALADHAAARADFERRLDGARAELDAAGELRQSLAAELVDSRATADRVRRRLVGLTLALRSRSRMERAALEAQLERQRADAERALSAKTLELRAAEEQIASLHAAAQMEREESERRRLVDEKELQRLNGEYEQARHSLDHLGASFAALEGVAADTARERARLESVLAERDAQLEAQIERHAAAETSAARALETLRQELVAARRRAAALQSDAQRAPVLQKELHDSQKENRRLFERAPYGLCRFMPDGTFIKANHSFARLLGYRKSDDIRAVSLGTVFECAPDLRWLIERTVGTATTQTIETGLKTKNGRRVEVRLHALGHSDGTVDVAVQDITAVRALEARLREAQRMEAVGRLASEIAVTCDMVLRDVTDGGREWLAAIDNHPELRQQGELLLGEVTRAAGFLRQFSVYGRKQMNALAAGSVQRVIRDLAPVLKRVAGDEIEWVLPKPSAAIEVDVDVERVERVLVNVASYARERMPHGGRVKIDVSTTVLGREFTSKYPNVRPGAHALITIAEVNGGAQRTSWVEPSADASASDSALLTRGKTGVDLGALLALLGDCGGHLWIAAERSGNMTLKVHLPRRVTHMDARPDAPPSPTHRVRQLAGWFRH